MNEQIKKKKKKKERRKEGIEGERKEENYRTFTFALD